MSTTETSRYPSLTFTTIVNKLSLTLMLSTFPLVIRTSGLDDLDRGCGVLLKLAIFMPRIVIRNKKPKIITTESTVTSHFKKIKGTSGLELFLISGIYRDRKIYYQFDKKI